jgi:hypothetical protein
MTDDRILLRLLRDLIDLHDAMTKRNVRVGRESFDRAVRRMGRLLGRKGGRR